MRAALGVPKRRLRRLACVMGLAAISCTMLPAVCGQAGEAAKEARPALPAPFVYLRDIDPTILQDIRYAGGGNFTGAKVEGYEAAECILTQETAEALRGVQAGLAARKLSLKVFDCYRPQRAVSAFVKWVRSPTGADETSPTFHPNVRKKQLIEQGYIAATSGHSRGDTVDLTLEDRSTRTHGMTDSEQSRRACNEPAKKLPSIYEIDMGTAFDCFDPKSATASPGLMPEEAEQRGVLLKAMQAGGFRNYRREWWHFTYGRGSGLAYDFPIVAKPSEQPR